MAGRKKKGFTPKETRWVRGYIERKFGIMKEWPNKEQRGVSKAAFEAISTGHTESREVLLWCCSWLSSAQWRSLKSTLGAWRYRQTKTGKEKKEIHIEHDAWLYLTTLAKRDGVTISSFLISRLGDEYRQTLKV